jgi:hypothetical protein
MTCRRALNSNLTLWNSLALLMVVAFAWKASFGEVGQADPRGERGGERVGCRAVVERIEWQQRRMAARTRVVPSAAERRLAGLRERGVAKLESGYEAAEMRLLAERLLSMPPPVV